MKTKALSEKKVYCPSEQVVTRTIADETILVPISGNLANMEQIFSLNEVGASIWQLLDGGKNLAEISEEMLKEFNVEEEQLHTDLSEFIAKLNDSGLIVEKKAG